MRALLIVATLLSAYAYAQNLQLDPIGGRYATDCIHMGAPTSGVYGKWFVHLLNNGYFARLDLFLNEPECNNLDVSLDIVGILNTNIPKPTSADLVNIDFGQEFRTALPVTDDGVNLLNTACNTDRFRLNREIPFWNLTCPSMYITPFSQCPMLYTIAQVSGNTISVAPHPTCTFVDRPPAVGPNPVQYTRLDHYPWFDGVWQSPCIPLGTESVSSEIQIANNFELTQAEFWYTGTDCNPDNLKQKVITTGLFEPTYPAKLSNTYEVEIKRRSFAIYPTTVEQAAYLTQKASNCGDGILFESHVLKDVSNVTCDVMDLVSVHDCPITYQIMGIIDKQLYKGDEMSVKPQPLSVYLCIPDERPTQLQPHGHTQMLHFPEPPTGPSYVGAVVVLVLLIVGLVIAAGWVIYKHRGNTVNALREFCCGGYAVSANSAYAPA